MTQQEYESEVKKFYEQLWQKLEEEKIEIEQPNRWKPKDGEEYWFVGNYGQITSSVYDNEDYDSWSYLTGNCFKSEKEAKEYKKQIEYTARYKNYIEEHSEPIDWENDKQCKYLVEFSYNGHMIKVSDYYALKKQGAIYASSPEIIRDAIKEIGEDNFKKYVLGVK